MYSGMCFPQRGEVTEQSTIHVEVLRVEKEVQWPGDGIVQNEGSSKQEIVKGGELRTRDTLTLGWKKRVKRTCREAKP